jgi:PilZ domain
MKENAQADRRHSDRFPIEREVHYKVLNKRSSEEMGDGKTVNISSSGILFSAEHMLLPGRRMELAISWPAQLNNKCALKLVARGRVVRFEGGRAALEIQQYEFRTQPMAASTVSATPAAPSGLRPAN